LDIIIKKILSVLLALYLLLSSIAMCFFLLNGEIKLKQECINEKGFFVGLLIGCDSYNKYEYNNQITKRIINSAIKGLFFPYFIFEN